jgi:DNA mismatch endonuclease, patch repair protein
MSIMADVFTPQRRSAIMALIRSTGNASTEQRLVRLLRANGFKGWRRGLPLLGSPDFVWKRERLVLFVDGCFWHGCPRHGRAPRSRVAYWTAKLARNARRDRKVTRMLRAKGWTVLRVWECRLTRQRIEGTTARIARALGRCP